MRIKRIRIASVRFITLLYHEIKCEIVENNMDPKKKILLVEDDMFLRDIYVEVLTREGFQVLTADEGEAGLHLGQNNLDATLMLLDIMLPKMHGIDVLKQLKANPSTAILPVVMLTNLTEESVVQEALGLGAIGFLVKVRYTPPEVVAKIKEFITFQEQHQSQQQQAQPQASLGVAQTSA